MFTYFEKTQIHFTNGGKKKNPKQQKEPGSLNLLSIRILIVIYKQVDLLS